MAYMNKYQSDDYRRDELIRIIEHSVEKLTLAELEALYYDMTTKSYINGVPLVASDLWSSASPDCRYQPDLNALFE